MLCLWMLSAPPRPARHCGRGRPQPDNSDPAARRLWRAANRFLPPPPSPPSGSAPSTPRRSSTSATARTCGGAAGARKGWRWQVGWGMGLGPAGWLGGRAGGWAGGCATPASPNTASPNQPPSHLPITDLTDPSPDWPQSLRARGGCARSASTREVSRSGDCWVSPEKDQKVSSTCNLPCIVLNPSLHCSQPF